MAAMCMSSVMAMHLVQFVRIPPFAMATISAKIASSICVALELVRFSLKSHYFKDGNGTGIGDVALYGGTGPDPL
jgi:hypothetical protein